MKVQWDPLPQQYANGRILGYRIYYYEYSSYLQKTVNTSIPDVNMVTLIGLMSGQRYYITVAALLQKVPVHGRTKFPLLQVRIITLQQLRLIFETSKAGIVAK